MTQEAAPSTVAPSQRPGLAQALETISRLRTMVEEQRAAVRQPIAVVGVGCRFPGGADSPDRLWTLLNEGVDATAPFPADRWDSAPYYDPDPEAPAKTYVLRGGFVDSVDAFDAQLFGISPSEAVGMDPQQRMALEVALEALQRAGIPHDTLDGSRTGVYLGASTTDYARLRQQFGEPTAIDAYQMLGEPSFLAGRIAHTFGLRGPAQVMDTACSSSLVAVHTACRGLRSGEIDLALAGGVNLILSPYGFVLVSKASAVSPDGRCKAFDASADGYARGEGCGMVVLKRLSDAQADGDTVLAVIRGTAVGHDGHASGISVPNAEAQRDVIRAALDDAGIAPTRVGYVEAHGTGTALGDPIELRSLDAVIGPGRPRDQPAYIGSVKTNIGHLEAAAGIAGLIKAVLAVQHGEIPPSLHFHTPNPFLDWDALRLRVPTGMVPWPVTEGPRVAGLSSFGASGTNAHVVLEEAPQPPSAERPEAESERPCELLALSAHDERAVRDLAGRFADHLTASPELPLAQVCRSAHTGRAHQRTRATFVAENSAALAGALRDFSTGGGPAVSRIRPGRPARTVFLFSGQGAQYSGMGRELYATEPVFRDALDRCDALLRPHLDRPLVQLLHHTTDGSLDRTEITQPALFAVEYALAELWLSLGVRPTAVAGHSVGEYVALCVAGAVSLEDALTLIATRGRLMGSVTTPGAMLSVPLPEEEVAATILRFADRVSVAAVNGPRSTVCSGDAEAIDALFQEYAQWGVDVRKLNVSHAFHSSLMEPVLDQLRQAAARVRVTTPRIPVVSNLTGAVLDPDTLADPDYFARHARGTVRFHEGLLALRDSGADAFLEVGPGRTLLGIGMRSLPESSAGWLASLRHGTSEHAQFLDTLGALYRIGVPIDWQGLPGGADRRRVPLPTYAFQHKRFSFPTASAESSALGGPVRQPTTAEAGSSVAYDVRWRHEPLPVRGPVVPGRTLILADTSGTGEVLAEKLAAEGEICHLVFAESPPDRTGMVLSPGDPTAVRALLDAVGPVDRIVHLWSLDAPAGERSELADLAAARVCGPETVLHLVRALVDGADRAARPPRLWLVTRGAQGTGHEERPDGLAGAPLVGLGKVIALEHSELWGGCVDLDPATGGITELVTELYHGDDDDEVAMRSGGRLVPRLVARDPSRSDAPHSAEPPVHSDATYLITGGLGGLGLTIADWLVGLGARHVVLTGRGGLPTHPRPDSADATTQDRRAAVSALERRGATVTVAAADVCDERAMSAVLRRISDSGAPLRGVVHAAGTAGARFLAESDAQSLHDALRPKTDGAWLLHRLVGDLPLDFFLGMSSIASVWGSAHLGAYAAANQFLDTLAMYRRAGGQAGTSVNWGPWHVASGLGGDELLRRLEANGLRALPPEEGLRELGAALVSDTPRTVVCGVTWSTLKPLLESRRPRPLLTEIKAEPQSVADGPSKLLDEVLAAPEAEREAVLSRYVRSALAEQLGVDVDEITDEVSLVEMGLDSLGVMRLISDFRSDLRLSLPARTFFEEPAVGWAALLAGEIAKQH